MTASHPATFARPVKIRFAHCDPAGIVFFPQYLVLTNGLVEDWFNEALQIDYAHMIGVRRVVLPIVKLDCTFSKPSRMGEIITLSLALLHVGRSSLRIEITGRAQEETRFIATQVLVTTSLESGAAIDIPADIRTALTPFHSEQSGHSETLEDATP
jgi:4-hydroxybenzoyl-CoA thioesterase